MAEHYELLQQELAGKRYSLTRPRRVVFDALSDTVPLTMQELVAACSPSIDRASIYRTVSLYEQLGIVHRILRGWKYTLELSDAFQHHHHHMHCTRCGRTLTLPEDQQLEVRLRRLAAANGFTPHSHSLEISGICSDCQ